jgi:hypothetical protein
MSLREAVGDALEYNSIYVKDLEKKEIKNKNKLKFLKYKYYKNKTCKTKKKTLVDYLIALIYFLKNHTIDREIS